MIKKLFSIPLRFLRDIVGASVLLAGTFGAGAAYAADATAQSTAVVQPPAGLVRLGDLAFGSVIPGAAGGTVTINPVNDARSTTGSVTGVTSTFHAASFRANGGANVVGLILLPAAATITRQSGTEIMPLTNFTVDGATLNLFGQLIINLGPTGIRDFNVGATLAVGGDQEPGTYQGTFQVTTIYL